MRRIILQKQCERDVKRMARRGKDREKFLEVAELLESKGYLPTEYRPHKLQGGWAGFWECHIESDWLLIYDVTDEEVMLVRTGTHNDLFK